MTKKILSIVALVMMQAHGSAQAPFDEIQTLLLKYSNRPTFDAWRDQDDATYKPMGAETAYGRISELQAVLIEQDPSYSKLFASYLKEYDDLSPENKKKFVNAVTELMKGYVQKKPLTVKQLAIVKETDNLKSVTIKNLRRLVLQEKTEGERKAEQPPQAPRRELKPTIVQQKVPTMAKSMPKESKELQAELEAKLAERRRKEVLVPQLPKKDVAEEQKIIVSKAEQEREQFEQISDEFDEAFVAAALHGKGGIKGLEAIYKKAEQIYPELSTMLPEERTARLHAMGHIIDKWYQSSYEATLKQLMKLVFEAIATMDLDTIKKAIDQFDAQVKQQNIPDEFVEPKYEQIMHTLVNKNIDVNQLFGSASVE